MALSPLESFKYTRDWTKPADFPTFEDDETTVREDMQFQPDELKTFINNVLVSFINTELIPLVDSLVSGTITPDSVYTAAIQKAAVTLEKLAPDVTAKALGAPDKVNGVAADSSGNIAITGEDIPVGPSDSTTLSGRVNEKQTATQSLSVGEELADGDYFPFYDTSGSANKKTLWSNILAKIRAAFASTPLAVEEGGTSAKTAAEARESLGALSSAEGSVGTSNLGANVVTRAKMAIDAFTLADNAGAHNAVYRGKNLGSAVTAAQWAAIQAGTFEDLFIGDYWTINDVNWRIAAFDYYYNTGDVACTTHHVTIVSDTSLYSHCMNDTDITTGGYIGSKMYTEGLAQAKTAINNAFGASHILSHRQSLVNAVTNGKPSGGAWYDSTVELMTEQNVYGGKIFGAGNDGSTVPYLYTVDKSQFPLFAHDPSMISNRQWLWLRDVVSAARFAGVDSVGGAYYSGASGAGGVRPAFSIKA